jgi:hypothetical protein
MSDENVTSNSNTDTATSTTTTTTPTVHLVARNPAEMSASLIHLTDWFTQKVAQCRQEYAELSTARDVAKRSKWNYKALANQAVRAGQRVMFYEKCLAATVAGYTIIPNIPVDVFAIRVNRDTPAQRTVENETASPHYWDGPTLRDENCQLLPVGDGSYKSPSQIVETDRYEKAVDGKTITVRSIWPTDYMGIEFPIIASIPEVMTTTQLAMTKGIFDEIGVSPRNVRKGDPLIVGRILMPKVGYSQKTVSFLIAWYLDMRTL